MVEVRDVSSSSYLRVTAKTTQRHQRTWTRHRRKTKRVNTKKKYVWVGFEVVLELCGNFVGLVGSVLGEGGVSIQYVMEVCGNGWWVLEMMR